MLVPVKLSFSSSVRAAPPAPFYAFLCLLALYTGTPIPFLVWWVERTHSSVVLKNIAKFFPRRHGGGGGRAFSTRILKVWGSGSPSTSPSYRHSLPEFPSFGFYPTIPRVQS